MCLYGWMRSESFDVFTIIGDIASAGLSVNEERRYDTPGSTVLQVVAPSKDRISSGFVLGPFTVRPLNGGAV